jgi:carbon-monoxide dehydrogenase small subunit
MTFELNGKTVQAGLDPSLSLLDFLRDSLGEPSAKICCNTGECGACAVLLDGKPVNSCVVLAADARDATVVTAEGIAAGGALHPIQAAFIDTAASQCGYCTPGFVITTKALLDEHPNPTMDEIKEYVAGNICRCTGYTKILEAIRQAATAARPGA